MQEQAELQIISELMRLAQTVDVLDRGAMEELQARRDSAISAGCVDESLRYHLLDIVLKRALDEYPPEASRECSGLPCCILDELEVSKHLFFPSREEFPEAVAVPVASDVEVKCYHHRTHADMPTLVHFHGNGECVADYLRIGYIDLLQRSIGDINVLLVEYRGFGGSQGHPRFVRMLRDGPMIINALGLYPSQCVAYGRSIGSIYAIEVAHRLRSLRGIIIDSGIFDVTEFLRHSPRIMQFLAPHWNNAQEALVQHFDTQAKLAAYPGCALVMHTANDSIVPFHNSTGIFESLASARKHLRIYEQGNHNTIFAINREDMLTSIRHLFAEAFSGKSA